MTDKVKELEKEIARLTRRNKLLTKRLKKLEAENEDLNKEIEVLEAYNEIVEKPYREVPSICPTCGSSLTELGQPDGSTFLMCSEFPICNYREKIKND